MRSRGENFTTEFTNYTSVVARQVLQQLVLLLLVVLAVLQLRHHQVALVVGQEVHPRVRLHALLQLLLLLRRLAQHVARHLRRDYHGLLLDRGHDLHRYRRREVGVVLVILGIVVVLLCKRVATVSRVSTGLRTKLIFTSSRD